jgi:hypothetical protein
VLKTQQDLQNLDLLAKPEVIQNCFSYFDKSVDIKNFTPDIFGGIKNSIKIPRLSIIKLLDYRFIDFFFIMKQKLKKQIQ